MRRARDRRIVQARVILDAARRLTAVRGSAFTLQDLAKEAGVALQTFYRYFASKDELLLAVMEETISEACQEYEARSRSLSDPIERLHLCIMATLDFDHPGGDINTARFITSEHWRLHSLYPAELAQATKPYADLILREVHAGTEAGALRPHDPESAAWLINQLVQAVFHHYAFAPEDAPREGVSDQVWRFCLAALGGRTE
jgi:TetR/AcrR family transcriptional regulator